MAAPSSLKHYGLSHAGGSAWSNASGGAAVAAGRALVVSKVTVANTSTSTAYTVSLSVGAAGSGAAGLIAQVSIPPNSVYTETGVVVLAGESLFAMTAAPTDAIRVNVFGEEVDN